MAALLLDAGLADPNLPASNTGQRPLDAVLESGSASITRMLMQRGACAEADHETHLAVPRLVVAASSTRTLGVAREMLCGGADALVTCGAGIEGLGAAVRAFDRAVGTRPGYPTSVLGQLSHRYTALDAICLLSAQLERAQNARAGSSPLAAKRCMDAMKKAKSLKAAVDLDVDTDSDEGEADGEGAQPAPRGRPNRRSATRNSAQSGQRPPQRGPLRSYPESLQGPPEKKRARVTPSSGRSTDRTDSESTRESTVAEPTEEQVRSLVRVLLAATLRQISVDTFQFTPGSGDLRASRALVAHGDGVRRARGAVRYEIEMLRKDPAAYCQALRTDTRDEVVRARAARLWVQTHGDAEGGIITPHEALELRFCAQRRASARALARLQSAAADAAAAEESYRRTGQVEREVRAAVDEDDEVAALGERPSGDDDEQQARELLRTAYAGGKTHRSPSSTQARRNAAPITPAATPDEESRRRLQAVLASMRTGEALPDDVRATGLGANAGGGMVIGLDEAVGSGGSKQSSSRIGGKRKRGAAAAAEARLGIAEGAFARRKVSVRVDAAGYAIGGSAASAAASAPTRQAQPVLPVTQIVNGRAWGASTGGSPGRPKSAAQRLIDRARERRERQAKEAQDQLQASPHEAGKSKSSASSSSTAAGHHIPGLVSSLLQAPSVAASSGGTAAAAPSMLEQLGIRPSTGVPLATALDATPEELGSKARRHWKEAKRGKGGKGRVLAAEAGSKAAKAAKKRSKTAGKRVPKSPLQILGVGNDSGSDSEEEEEDSGRSTDEEGEEQVGVETDSDSDDVDVEVPRHRGGKGKGARGKGYAPASRGPASRRRLHKRSANMSRTRR